MSKFPTDYWYSKLIEPRHTSPDEKRRELILNIMLAGLTLINLLSTFSAINIQLQGSDRFVKIGTLIAQLLFLSFVLVLWKLSRMGYYKIGSFVLLGLIFIGATELMITYSYTLPSTQLVFAIFLVATSVLLSARTALVMTFLVCAHVLVFSYLQVYGYLDPDTSWLNQKLQMIDSIGFIGGLLGIGLVSWLANREIDRSLIRARASEAALESERDQLEVKVVERTRALEQAQLVRVMELQRLAEFGRMSAGLLHDVADPLTVVSLNLKELEGKSDSLLARRALQSLQYIERFLNSARKQLKSQGNITTFVVADEIEQVVSILGHRLRKAEVEVILDAPHSHKLSGDPVKFSQIIANLILNGVEAYDSALAADRQIKISLQADKKYLSMTVSDYGKGLDADQIDHIFEPFYSTKPLDQPHMGIGLATVKTIVETDFKGRVAVTSSPAEGTRFVLSFKSKLVVKD